LKGNRKAKKAWGQFGNNLGAALAIVIDILDPEIVVIGGKMSNAYNFFIKQAKERLKRHSFKYTYSKVKITKARLKNSGVIGAALLF